MKISIPGRSDRKGRRRSRGLTLIELMVTFALVGLIFAMAATALRTVFDSSLKEASSHLSSTLRYLFHKSVTENVYLRMVYDLETNSYFVEETRDPALISPEEERQADPDMKDNDKGNGVDEEGEVDEAAATEEPPPFTASESRLLQSTPLPSGVYFKDVFVGYLGEKKEKGRAYTYFFPDGNVTSTLIHLRDEEDETHFTVQVMPYGGRVKVTDDYREDAGAEKK